MVTDNLGLGLLGKGSVRCGICNVPRAVIGWCDQCRKSYDRARLNDDGTVLASIMWAAKRARQFARLERKTKAVKR